MDGAESEILIYVKNMLNITNITVTGSEHRDADCKINLWAHMLELCSEPDFTRNPEISRRGTWQRGRTAKGEKEAKVYLERASQPEKV